VSNNSILRPRPSAAFIGLSYSGFNAARVTDPDFQDLVPVPIGERRAIGFFRNSLLKVLFRKQARRKGVPAEHVEAEVERLLIEELAHEQMVAEAKLRLEAKARIEKRREARV
jgi:hypothetical protein